MMKLARNKLQEELLHDLKEKGETKKLNEYVWQNGEQRYRVKFAAKTIKELAERLERKGYLTHYQEGENDGELTAQIVEIPF